MSVQRQRLSPNYEGRFKTAPCRYRYEHFHPTQTMIYTSHYTDEALRRLRVLYRTYAHLYIYTKLNTSEQYDPSLLTERRIGPNRQHIYCFTKINSI